MAVTEERYCPKCGKKVRMTRCETCKGTGGGSFSQCRRDCNMKGWFCPTLGKNY